jgi:regulator of ribonuclease activity A
MNTTELCDKLGDKAPFLPPRLLNFGGRTCFSGEVVTVKCYEDSSATKEVITCAGKGKVLVVDAGGSDRCAVFGDMSAQLMIDNGWEGVVINGYLRDVQTIASMELGVRALGSVPRGSTKRGQGLLNVDITIGSITCHPGDILVADADGIVILAPAFAKELLA